EHPTDVAAQTAVADLDLLGGHVKDAFDRLVRFIGRSVADDKDAARKHLLELYTVVGEQDERVAASRRTLAAALFYTHATIHPPSALRFNRARDLFCPESSYTRTYGRKNFAARSRPRGGYSSAGQTIR